MSEFLRWGELLLGLIHLSLMLDKRLFHGLYVSSFTIFRVYSHLSLHEIARQQHAHLVLIYMKAMCIMILLEEVDTVDSCAARAVVPDMVHAMISAAACLHVCAECDLQLR